MLLDSGVLRLFRKRSLSDNGQMPSYGYYTVMKCYYGTKTVGMSRYWSAQQANERIDMLVEIPLSDVNAGDAVQLVPIKRGGAGGFFTVLQSQQVLDDNNVAVTDLTLRRIEALEFPVWEDAENDTI